MSIETALATSAPRERAGAQTFARYQFQANFSLLEMLDAHERGEDYRVVFEHFDDVLLINSSTNPPEAHSYQVKVSESGKWSLAALTSGSSKSLPKSIVGKMYFNVAALGEHLTKANFISNAPYSLTLTDGTTTGPDHEKIACSSLNKPSLEAISKTLDADFPHGRTLSHEDRFVFRRTRMPTKDAPTYVKGRLVSLFEATGINGGVVAIYDTLISAAVARCIESTVFTSQAEFFLKKTLCRADVEALLAEAANRALNILDGWSLVEGELIGEGKTPLEILRIKSACIAYQKSLNRGDLSSRAFGQSCRDFALQNPAEFQKATTIGEAAELLRQGLAASAPDVATEAAYLTEAFEIMK